MGIRLAAPDRDGAACAAIYAPSVAAGFTSIEEVPPGPEEMAARIRRANATHCWLVEEARGRVTGYAYGSPHRAREAYRWAVEVAVYVGAAHHRQGVGRRLYEALLPRLRAQGYRMAYAGITLPNPASVGLHEATGFTPVGVFRNAGFKSGDWRDVSWWQLDLRPDDVGAPREPTPG